MASFLCFIKFEVVGFETIFLSPKRVVDLFFSCDGGTAEPALDTSYRAPAKLNSLLRVRPIRQQGLGDVINDRLAHFAKVMRGKSVVLSPCIHGSFK